MDAFTGARSGGDAVRPVRVGVTSAGGESTDSEPHRAGLRAETCHHSVQWHAATFRSGDLRVCPPHGYRK